LTWSNGRHPTTIIPGGNLERRRQSHFGTACRFYVSLGGNAIFVLCYLLTQ
jgi:hypothetical protein